MKSIQLPFFTLLLLFLFVSGIPALAAPFTPEPKPVLVLIEHNPWAMALGFDAPSFALYDNGLVIFIHSQNKSTANLFSTQLNSRQLNDFLELINSSSLFSLKSDYSLSDWTDQVTTDLFVFQKGKRKDFRVYGYSRKDKALAAAMPEQLRRILEQTIDFDAPGAKVWKPGKLEAFIWPYGYSTMKPLRWPKGWPDLKSPDTVKRGKDSYSIYLDGSRLDELVKLLSKLGEKQALLISGKKWTLSFRPTFPGEKEWAEHKPVTDSE